MKSKLKILIPVLVVAFGATYKVVLAKPAPVGPKKIEGHVYAMPKEFLVNLADGRFAKLGVALILAEDDHSLPAAGGHSAGPAPPEGYGGLNQEAVVRDIITDQLSGRKDSQLIEREGREKLKKKIAKSISKHTDVHVEDVLFTDVAVQ